MYIKGTSGYGITFRRRTIAGLTLQVFADAYYKSKVTNTRSVSGQAILCEGAYRYVSWFSRTRKWDKLSNTGAAYIAMGEAAKEFVFLR